MVEVLEDVCDDLPVDSKVTGRCWSRRLVDSRRWLWACMLTVVSVCAKWNLQSSSAMHLARLKQPHMQKRLEGEAVCNLCGRLVPLQGCGQLHVECLVQQRGHLSAEQPPLPPALVPSMSVSHQGLSLSHQDGLAQGFTLAFKKAGLKVSYQDQDALKTVQRALGSPRQAYGRMVSHFSSECCSMADPSRL